MSAAPVRGELWWCEPSEIGRRPVVVLSRDAAIPRLRRALVAPCTTTIRGLPSEVVVEPGDDPIGRRCAVHLDSVESVSTAVLVERMGALSGMRMREICQALEGAIPTPCTIARSPPVPPCSPPTEDHDDGSRGFSVTDHEGNIWSFGTDAGED